jgi:hypothetical protein
MWPIASWTGASDTSRSSKLIAPELERLAFRPCPKASFRIFRDQLFELGLGPLVLEMGFARVRQYVAANSAHELEALISTLRTASRRGRGGSTPK